MTMDYNDDENPVRIPIKEVEVQYIDGGIVSDDSINSTMTTMGTFGYVYEDSKVFPNNSILLVFRKKD